MWQVELQCPQCGGQITLEETDRILSCSFCRVRLALTYGDYFRYLLPSKESEGNSRVLTYVPYWRFKGVVFSCVGSSIDQRVLDTSLMAGHVSFSPLNLGVRAQALKLRLASPETEGRFLRVTLPLEEFLSKTTGYTGHWENSQGPPSIHYQTAIGETSSLIYSPVYFEGNNVYDAVLDRVMGPFLRSSTDDSASFDRQSQWQMNFVPIICPDCGWDLQGEKDTLVLLCRNCESAWALSSSGLNKISHAVIPEGQTDVYYFPFWRLAARVEGLHLESYADLVRLANLPKTIKEEWHGRNLYYWFPAFKAPGQMLLRLARLVSIFQPAREELQEELPRAPFYPVTIPASEASRGIKITIASMAVPKKTIFPRLGEIKVTIGECLLVFLPFVLSGNEFVHSEMQLGINRGAMHLAKFL